MIFLRLYVDLGNIIDNIELIHKQTNKEVMIVLKNNAYGTSSKEIIKALNYTKVKFIVYNTFFEYLKDKDYLDNYKILILSSVKKIDVIDNKNIYYSVNSIDDALLFSNVKFNVNVHIQVDTGMNRIGIRSIEEYIKVLTILKSNKYINIDGIYTHFGSNCDEYEYYNNQCLKFNEYLKYFKFNNIHSAATSSLHKNIIGNSVRVGLGIYGYGNPYILLKPSIKFSVEIINKFSVHTGEMVGYDQEFVASCDTNIGVLPIGYNDISYIDLFYYNNTECKVIGKRCMNHTFVSLPKENNNISSLLVLPKNDIIYKKEYNWYYILTSMKNINKIYIRRFNYDIPTILKTTNKENKKYIIRRRSN